MRAGPLTGAATALAMFNSAPALTALAADTTSNAPRYVYSVPAAEPWHVTNDWSHIAPPHPATTTATQPRAVLPRDDFVIERPAENVVVERPADFVPVRQTIRE